MCSTRFESYTYKPAQNANYKAVKLAARPEAIISQNDNWPHPVCPFLPIHRAAWTLKSPSPACSTGMQDRLNGCLNNYRLWNAVGGKLFWSRSNDYDSDLDYNYKLMLNYAQSLEFCTLQSKSTMLTLNHLICIRPNTNNISDVIHKTSTFSPLTELPLLRALQESV